MQGVIDYKAKKKAAARGLEVVVPSFMEQLEEIDARLAGYFEELMRNADGHNLFELLGGLRFLRLLFFYTFDVEKVKFVIRAYEGEWVRVERGWRHVGGGVKHPGTYGATYYRLEPFQVFVLAGIFGPHAWKDVGAAGSRELLDTEKEEDGRILDKRRLCNEFVLFTPRKAAKTELSAFIQFIFFMFEDYNAECYCCANSSDQSKILFKRTKELIQQLDPQEKRIRFTETEVNWKGGQPRAASLTALSAGGKTKDGLFAQLCCADEYGSAQYVKGKSDMGSLVSVVQSSMGPRREPLTFITTTAGKVNAGPFIDKLAGLERLLLDECDGEGADTVNDNIMMLLLQPDKWEVDAEYLFTHPEVQRKVNPMIGVTVQTDFYPREIAASRLDDEKKRETLTKLFNVYQTDRVKDWVSPAEIRALQIPYRIEDLTADNGWLVFCGLDFSLGDDLHSMTYLGVNRQTGEFFADMDAWVSEEAVANSSIRELLEKWIADGWLRMCSGKTLEPAVPVDRIVKLSERVEFAMFGYDPYKAKIPINALTAWLSSLGEDPTRYVVPVRQNFATYNPLVGEMDFLIKRDPPLIHFSMNPMWPWEFGNCVLGVSNDGMENRKPVKAHPGSDACKVDNVQGLLSALYCFDLLESKMMAVEG